LAIARTAHLRQPADAEEESRQRVVVRPRVPGLEVEPDRERRAVAAIARPERVQEAQIRLALDRRRALSDLVREQVVVHRDDPERMADERDLEERHRPDPEHALGPCPEPRLAARVVAKPAAREHRVERREIALEARRLSADHLARPEGQLEPVDVEEELVELRELPAPVRRRPPVDAPGVRRAEVPVVVRPDRSEEHTSELQSPYDLVCRLLLEK